MSSNSTYQIGKSWRAWPRNWVSNLRQSRRRDKSCKMNICTIKRQSTTTTRSSRTWRVSYRTWRMLSLTPSRKNLTLEVISKPTRARSAGSAIERICEIMFNFQVNRYKYDGLIQNIRRMFGYKKRPNKINFDGFVDMLLFFLSTIIQINLSSNFTFIFNLPWFNC